MLPDVSTKSKVILFVLAMLFGAFGVIATWTAGILISDHLRLKVWTVEDHNRLDQIYNLELQRARQAQGK
jgi:hypothetical protein